MVTLYFAPLILMLTGVVEHTWLNLLMWTLMAFGMSGIGLSIMHDANHGSYSKKQTVNKSLGWLIHFIGGYHNNWKIQHNVLHHSFTNVHEHDEDIELDLMRFSPNQQRKSLHRFQAYYAPILYGMMTFYWSLWKDFYQWINYNKKDLIKVQGTHFWKRFN